MSSTDSSSRIAVTSAPCHSIATSSATLSSTVGASTLFAAITGKRWRLFSLYIYHSNSSDVKIIASSGSSFITRYALGARVVGYSTSEAYDLDWAGALSTQILAVVGTGSYDPGGFTYVEASALLLPMAFTTTTGD